MAPNNKGLPPIPAGFLSQIIFGGFLIFILSMAGFALPLSIFLGIIAGLILGWFTNVSKHSPQPATVASSDGIDAALKYWLFFLIGFVILGYSPPMSILLGGIAAVGGGWITAWWGSNEVARTQLPDDSFDAIADETPRDRVTRQQKRRTSRRYRRPSGSFNFRFWER